MPLHSGSSNATKSKNIKELVHKYERTGSIGTSHPKSKKKATKQAVAIAMQKAGNQNEYLNKVANLLQETK